MCGEEAIVEEVDTNEKFEEVVKEINDVIENIVEEIEDVTEKVTDTTEDMVETIADTIENVVEKIAVKIEEDAKGQVGTVTIAMRPRDSREKSLPYKSKKLKNLRMAVQRLVLICPAKKAKEMLVTNQATVKTQINAVINGQMMVIDEMKYDADEESVEERPAVRDDPQHLDEDEESVEEGPKCTNFCYKLAAKLIPSV